MSDVWSWTSGGLGERGDVGLVLGLLGGVRGGLLLADGGGLLHGGLGGRAIVLRLQDGVSAYVDVEMNNKHTMYCKVSALRYNTAICCKLPWMIAPMSKHTQHNMSQALLRLLQGLLGLRLELRVGLDVVAYINICIDVLCI